MWCNCFLVVGRPKIICVLIGRLIIDLYAIGFYAIGAGDLFEFVVR